MEATSCGLKHPHVQCVGPFTACYSQEARCEGTVSGWWEGQGLGGRTHLLLLVEALLVAVGDVDTPGAQHIQELQVVQYILHFPAARPLWGVVIWELSCLTKPHMPEPAWQDLCCTHACSRHPSYEDIHGPSLVCPQTRPRTEERGTPGQANRVQCV